MSDPVLGEIRPFAGNYAPENWLPCDGRLVSINDNQALYTLLGTAYGGDGRTTFGLPDLRGRLPVCQGQGTNLTNRVLGQMAGASAVTLSETQLPAHTHTFSVSGNPGSTNTPGSGAILAVPQPQTGGTMNAYAAPGAGGTPQTFATGSIQAAPGGAQAHSNVMPYLAIMFIIATVGNFPQRPN